MRAVPHRQPAEYRHSPRGEVGAKDVDHRPLTRLGLGCANELPGCLLLQAVEESFYQKLRQDSIDLPDLSIHGLEEEDCAGEIWTGPSDSPPNQVEVSAHQDAAGRSLNHPSRRDLGCTLMERPRLWLHQRPAQ